MTAGISAILPTIVSGATFSSRRTDKGLHEAHPIVSTANFIIAGGQMYKAFENSASISKDSNNIVSNFFRGAEERIRTLSKGDKVIRGFDKFFKLVGDSVNYFITIASALKVIFADDKETAAWQEGLGLPTMFLFETAAKNFMGMSKFERINGKNIAIERDALYEEVKCVKKVVDKFVKYCNKTEVMGKSLKYLSSVLKGMAFVAASITGYKLGSYVGTNIAKSLKENRENNTKNVSIQPQLLTHTNARSVA